MHKDIIQNKYFIWYEQLINTRKQHANTRGKFFETHHILPRNMGGSDADSNLIKLTPREHYLAHILLSKCCINESRAKTLHTLHKMSGNNIEKINSRKYEFAKLLIQKIYFQMGKPLVQDIDMQYEVLREFTDFLKAYDRGVCSVCKIRPKSINYIKNGKTYFRSKCEGCENKSISPLSTPKWVINGYIKKSTCEYCGFEAKFEEQLTVFDLGKHYKTACLNCRIELKLTSFKPKADF